MAVDGKAVVHNGRLNVSLPLWQVLVIVGAAAAAALNNFITTDRTMHSLGNKIENLTHSVEGLNHVVRDMNERTIENENRLGILEDRGRRQGG